MAKTKKKTYKEFYENVGLAQDPNKKVKKTKKTKQPHEFVQKLEKEANKPTKKNFKFGKVMCEELNYYIEKYGDDYESMARDKRNIYQDSPGQLRYVTIIKRPDELEQEKIYRERYNNLQDWNEKYWGENNDIFNREKAKYIKKNFGSSVNDEALSHDQLAPFYREFLDKNRPRHISYNKTWYKQMISLLCDSLKAKAARLTKGR